MTNTFETQAQECKVSNNTFHVEKPCHGSNASISLSNEAPTQFEFGLEDIAGFQVLDDGSLLISFIDGEETLVIENYAAIAANGQFQNIELSDGEIINLPKLAQGLSSPETTQVAEVMSVEDLANIETAAGEQLTEVITKSQEITVVEGQAYVADFNQTEVTTAQVNDNGDLVITFDDETQTIITNFTDIQDATDIPQMTLADGTVINVTDLLTTVAVFTEDETETDSGETTAAVQSTPSAPAVEEGQEIAQLRPEDLAAIEPAAGAEGPIGDGSANFESAIDGAGLAGIGAVGPIGVTSLQFDRPELEDDDFFFSPEDVTPPVLIVNQAAGFEDTAINFGIFAQSSDVEECIEVVVEDIPVGWTPVLTDPTTAAGVFDAAAGTWTLSLGVGETLTSGPVFLPPKDSDEDITPITVTVNQKDPVTLAVSSSSTNTFNVIVDAVADNVNLSATNVVGTEDMPAPLNIATSLRDVDGSEEITQILICNVPTEFTLNNGVFDAVAGGWIIDQADLATLEITPPANYSGTISLEVKVASAEVNFSDTEFDFTNNDALLTLPFDVTFNPVADEPTLIVDDVRVKEDGTVDLPIKAELTDPSETLIIRVQNLDNTWGVSIGANNGVYNAVTGTWEITLPAGQNYDGAITLTPPADSDGDMPNILVQAISMEIDGTIAQTSEMVNVITDAVADTPDLNAGADKTVSAGQSVAINITNAVTDTDGSESLGNVTISGVPTGYSLSAGTQVSPGVWEVEQGDLAGLAINVPADATAGMFNLTVSVTATDTPTDTEYDFTDNTATNTDTVKITVNPDRNPPEVTFGTNGSGEGEVLEDGSVFVPITGTLNGLSPQILTVTVSGIDPTWTITTGANNGVYNAATGIWTITLPEGQDYDGGLTFTPAADSDVDLTGLIVTAASELIEDGSISETSTNGEVIVDAVADTPTIDAGADQTVDAGQSVVLNISNALTDVDGSESLGNVTISGVPTGYSLSAGTQVAPGVWEVNQSNIAGLTLNTPANANDGMFELTVSVDSTEQVTDGEFRLDNNVATNTDKIKITIIADDDPVLSNPTPLVVDETDLNPEDTDGNVLSGDFGRDGPGTYEVGDVSTFSFSGAEGGNLTSNGVAVVVSVEGNSFVGRAGAEEVFRLNLNETTGRYDFTLKGTLDHADETNPDDIIELKFGVDAKDTDDGVDSGFITVNVKDDAPVANDDCNEFNIVRTGQDYNVVLALDISGSMEGDRIALLKASVSNLLNDFGAYQGGDIKVHITTFSSTIRGEGTFAVTEGTGLNDALAFIDGFTAAGTTNYEAPLQSAISWLEGDSNNDPIANADTYTYFVSDGAPNRYIDNGGNVVSGGAGTVMGEITGSDGTDEVSALQALSTEVISVGIGVDGTTLARLGQIDSDGNALDVQNPTDLDAALQSTSPLNGRATGNVITGENGGVNAADDQSKDVDNVVTKVTFGGNIVDVDLTNGAVIDGDYGTLVIQSDGSYTYTVTAQNLSGDIVETFGYTIKDGDDDTSDATLSLKGNFTPIDLPPEVKFGDGTSADGSAQVLEDGSVFVPIVASLNGIAPQQLTVEVSGIDPSWTITTGASNGTYNAGTGTWTITLPAGQDYGGGLTFKPAADSDIDLTGLDVTATSRNTNTNAERSTTVDGSIIVDAVADMPNLDAGSDKSVVAGQSVALNVSNSLTDTDGSESLGNVTISGVPTGYSLSVGTQVSPGIWEVAQGDIAGLRLNTPANGSGMVTLTVSVTATESVTDVDFNLNNNTAVKTDTVKITVTPARDDKPEVEGASEMVDETSLVNGMITETGAVLAEFGADGPGRFELDGRFTSSGADNGNLTHNGVDVVVTRVGDTYFGKAGTIDVFTLKLNANGSYEFKLIENLDHNQPDQDNEIINLNFGFIAIDNDGDTASETITVSVKDDVPFISDKARQIDEDGLENGPISHTHTLNHSFGQDGVGSIDPTGNFAARYELNGPDISSSLQSNGRRITVTQTPTGYVGKAGTDVIFTLVVNNQGQYTYTQYDGIDHQDANDPNDVVWLRFEVKITDFDGDSDTAIIMVDVQDSAPTAVNDSTQVDEGQMVTGNVLGNDIVRGDDPAVVSVIDGQVVGVNGQTIIGQFGTLVIQQDGSYKYTANSNNPDGVDQFTYIMTDADGDASSARLSVTVTSENDVPVAKNDVVTMWSCDWATIGNVITNYNQDNNGADHLSEDGGNQVISIKFGGKTFAFKQGGEALSIPTQYGFLFVFKDGTYSYISEQATPTNAQDEVFTYTIADADGDTSSATLTLNSVEAGHGQTNDQSDYGNQASGPNTVIDGQAAYKTDNTEGALVFGFEANDRLSGNVGNDAIYGWEGDDTLYGGDGNDFLFGEQDNNTLHGGSGADIFIIEDDKANNNTTFDTIVDFNLDEGDILSLSDVISGFGSGDDINDFVRISLDGNTAVVQVNTDGQGGDFYNVAKIQSNTNLDARTLNVDDLFDKGHIDVY